MPTYIEQPPHGYVRLVSHHGSDIAIVGAARTSYAGHSQGQEKDKRLLFRLYKDRHTSPFEQVSITFNIKFPIFLMRQFVRHRTFRLNEFSARYKELPDQFYIPREWRAQEGATNHQGSVSMDKQDDNYLAGQIQRTRMCEQAYEHSYVCYKWLIDSGVSREQARMVLPVGIYTEIFVNIDLHNLCHFLRLRLDPHAQVEIQEVARAMKDIATDLFPWTMEAFSRYKVVTVDANEG